MLRNEHHDRVPKIAKPAMKEMFATVDDQQLRPRRQRIHPLDGLIDVDEFVLVSLHDEPGAVGLRRQGVREPTDRRATLTSPSTCVTAAARTAIAAPNEKPESHSG